MKTPNLEFCGHLHSHREYSPLDGGGSCNEHSHAAALAGHTHLGLTDHGRLGAALEHIDCCRSPEKYDNPLDPSKQRSKDERITPILGLEAYYRPDRFADLTDIERYGKNGHNWAHHLCLHAGSLAGWRTLMRLSSKSWVRREQGGGYHGRPCIDLDMVQADHEDIIISTACLSSPLAWFVLNGDERGAKRWLNKMRKCSKNGKIWLEIMPHDLEAQRDLNIGIVNIAYDTGDPLLATQDVHIPFKNWKLTHQVIRLASYKQTFKHREAKKDAGEEVYTDEIDTVYHTTASEMYKQFRAFHPDLPPSIVQEAMANTKLFAQQVRWYQIGKTTKAPEVKVDAPKVVLQWMDQGWERLKETYPESHWDKWPRRTYTDRMKMEYGVLDNKNVLSYFYIVGDFVRWAKSTKPLPIRKANGSIYFPKGKSKRPIRVGLGRGSAAGSLASYLIGITAIDPISHRLKFERFLNPDRVGYPDIDMDFETGPTVIETADGRKLDGRECVKEYLKIVYGHDHVVDIIAYQTFAPRALIKEVGFVYDIDPNQLNRITKTIGDTDRGLAKIASGNPDKSIPPNEEVARLRDKNPEMWEVMLKLEDSILRDTRHAGGVVITPKPTNYYMPTQIAVDEETTVTAWADRADFPVVSDYGFLKYDILGVKSLDKMQTCVSLIEEYYDEQIEPNDLPALRDPYAVDQNVIDNFVLGVSWNVFQFGGEGITQLLRHIKPDNATDISVANALYRPGPIAIAFEYGDRKNGKRPVKYWHDSLEPILGETLGLMCFQEQAMEMVQVLAGFTGGEADNLRKIMSKLYRLPGDKAQEIMSKDRDKFIHGCMTISDMREQDAESLFDDRMLPLGNYLFNRSHSASYGLQAYQDMHLKTFYPLAFYAASFTTTKKAKKEEQQEWMRNGLREARIFEIDAVPPDINRSSEGWRIDNGKLRYGLVSINGLGGGLVNHIVDNRPFEGYRDFAENMPSSFGADKMVALAKAGAFDSTDKRKFLLSKTRQWNDDVVKIKIKMSCGHLKSKTFKRVGSNEEAEQLINQFVDDAVCKHHPDATPATTIQLDDTYEVARFLKEHPDREPQIVWQPSTLEVNEMELAALNISLSQGKIALLYKDFMDEIIYTEPDLEVVPAKPKRRNNKHGAWCTCLECKAAEVVVGGDVTAEKVIKTKNGDAMAFVTFKYGVNEYSCTFFPNQWALHQDLLKRPTSFFVSGHKEVRDGRTQVSVNDIVEVTELAAEKGWEPKKVKRLKPKLKKKTSRRTMKLKAAA